MRGTSPAPCAETRNAFIVALTCLSVALTSVGIVNADPLQSTIVAWGNNDAGQTDVPNANTDFVAIAAGYAHSLALKADGAIVAWGCGSPYDYGQCTVSEPNVDFVAIAAGDVHSLALKGDGSIVAWGWNAYGQAGVPSPNSGFIAIATTSTHSLALQGDGSVVGWGGNSSGQIDVPTPNFGFVAVACSGFCVGYGKGCEYCCLPGGFSLGLKADGSIVGWGYNGDGQTNVPTPNADFIGIAAGGFHSLGLKANGSIVAWGYNGEGQANVPAPNADFIGIAAGFNHSLGLKIDGSIVAWGRNYNGQTNVPAPNTGFVTVAAGGYHSLAIRQRYGACCDLRYGRCAESVVASACSGTQQAWTEGAFCVDVECDAVTGACCNHDPFGVCTDDVTLAACDCPTCEWAKLTSCSELDCPHAAIPTVGEWGMVVLTLLLLIGAKLAFRRGEVRLLSTN